MAVNNKEQNRLSYETRRRLFACALLLFPIVLFLIFYVYGRLYSIYIAFAKMDFLGKSEFLGFGNLFDNFISLFSQLSEDGSLLRISFFNSLKTWLLNFVISNPLYYIFSYFIFKKTFGSGFVRVVSLLPNMISSLIFTLAFKQVVNQPLIEIMELFGIKDFPNMLSDNRYTYGLVIFYNIWSSFGMSVIFFSNAMSGISPEVLESAQIDGVDNMFQEMVYILIPMTFSTFRTLLVIGLTTVFTNSYGLLNFYMYGAPAEVWHMGYYYTVKIYNTSSTGYPIVAASGIILALLSTPIVLFVKKFTERIDPMDN